MLHPPAILEATIPFAEAGRLSARVAIHPEAWGQEGAGGCHFTVTVDSLAEASVMLDPHTHPSHRHWIDIAVCVPASDTGDATPHDRNPQRGRAALRLGALPGRDVRSESPGCRAGRRRRAGHGADRRAGLRADARLVSVPAPPKSSTYAQEHAGTSQHDPLHDRNQQHGDAVGGGMRLATDECRRREE